jgi:Ca2+-binding EF-hand superfamily protein
MKPIALRITITAALLAASPALAAADGAATEQSCREQRRARMLEKLDTNKDGRVDENERAAARAERRARALARFDKDKDGRLDKKEREEMRYQLMLERFERLDKNHDGELSRDELPPCSPLALHFDQIDTNKDGRIEWSEYEAAVKRFWAMRWHRFHRQGGPQQP